MAVAEHPGGGWADTTRIHDRGMVIAEVFPMLIAMVAAFALIVYLGSRMGEQ